MALSGLRRILSCFCQFDGRHSHDLVEETKKDDLTKLMSLQTDITNQNQQKATYVIAKVNVVE